METISAMLCLYLSACKFCNFWSPVPPICEFICLWVAGDKQSLQLRTPLLLKFNDFKWTQSFT